MSEFKRLKFDAQGIFPGYPGGKGFQIGIQASTKIIPVSTPATVPTTEEVLVLFNDFKLSPSFSLSSIRLEERSHFDTCIFFHFPVLIFWRLNSI